MPNTGQAVYRAKTAISVGESPTRQLVAPALIKQSGRRKDGNELRGEGASPRSTCADRRSENRNNSRRTERRAPRRMRRQARAARSSNAVRPHTAGRTQPGAAPPPRDFTRFGADDGSILRSGI